MMNDTLTELEQLQDWCYVGLDHLNDLDNANMVPCSELSFFNGGQNLDLFLAGVSLKIDDPDPEVGLYITYIKLGVSELAMLKHVDGIFHWAFAFSRDKSVRGWNCLTNNNEYGYWNTLRYKETVLIDLAGTISSSFTTTINGEALTAGSYSTVVPAGWNVLQIESDLLVEYWEEYVNYGYIDWFMAMGGLMSIGITAFFFIGDKLPRLFNHSSMGILPRFSVIYKNTKHIYEVNELVKTLVEQTGLTKCQRATGKEHLVGQISTKAGDKKTMNDICSSKTPDSTRNLFTNI